MRLILLALFLAALAAAPAHAAPNLLRQADVQAEVVASAVEIDTADEFVLGYLPVGNACSPVSVWVTTACTGTAALDWYVAGADAPPASTDASAATTYAIESSFAAKASISSNGAQTPVQLSGLYPCGYLVFIGVSSNPPTELCTVSITARCQRYGQK